MGAGGAAFQINIQIGEVTKSVDVLPIIGGTVIEDVIPEMEEENR